MSLTAPFHQCVEFLYSQSQIYSFYSDYRSPISGRNSNILHWFCVSPSLGISWFREYHNTRPWLVCNSGQAITLDGRVGYYCFRTRRCGRPWRQPHAKGTRSNIFWETSVIIITDDYLVWHRNIASHINFWCIHGCRRTWQNNHADTGSSRDTAY